MAAENVSNDFGFIRFKKGGIFWKNTRTKAEGTSKDLDNSAIKLAWANRLVILYPFVYFVIEMNELEIDKLQRSANISMDLVFLRCVFLALMFS